jgi:eukaryotic-like serine/threonine-protein kinase
VAENDDIAAARTKAASTPPPIGGPHAAPTQLANRYTIVGLLGMGGMGRVYRAHDNKLDEVVALKMLRKELLGQADMLERFRQEVKLARRVTSPHVVRTFDLGEHGDEVFLTMEYIEGRSLAQRIDEGPLAVDEAIRIAHAISAGMAAAHTTGVLHRDLKPDNVLLGKDGRIAITDFGIARAASAATIATADRFAGTPAYMSPEQVEGAATIGPAADVYSFGTILFEMLTGRRPFVGSGVHAVALARLVDPPPDPRTFRTLPDDVAALVLRCMAREPGERFTNATELSSALAALGQVSADGPAARRGPLVPEKNARSVAILPFRGATDLADVAEGLSEEIADVLAMSRGLRVRPLGAQHTRPSDADARAIGTTLGVDVVVDGSVRRRGDRVRIAARVISVVDDFVLWANHVDTGPEGLLAAGDEVVRAIAEALTVQIAVPARPVLGQQIAELYLQAKAHLRAGWIQGDVQWVIDELDRALPKAPNDAAIVATLAMALARRGFFGATKELERAKVLAARAIVLGPSSGDAWLAHGWASLYSGASVEAGRSFARAIQITPGLAMAQAMLGATLLEAGEIEDGIAHLEAAVSIEPSMIQLSDLARAYCYIGRFDEGIQLLLTPPRHQFTEYLIGRLELWRGKSYSFFVPREDLSPLQLMIAEISERCYGAGAITEDDYVAYKAIVATTPKRFRASQTQYLTELLAYTKQDERAMEALRISVDAGLHDLCWIERCPLLQRLQSRPEYEQLAAVVRERAVAIVAAIREARA